MNFMYPRSFLKTAKRIAEALPETATAVSPIDDD